MIQYFSGGKAVTTTLAMQGSGRIWMKNVMCDSNTHVLADCDFDGWGEVTDCIHAHDVVIQCYRKYFLITVKLYFHQMSNLDHISFLPLVYN